MSSNKRRLPQRPRRCRPIARTEHGTRPLLAGIRAGGNNPCGLPDPLRGQWRLTQERRFRCQAPAISSAYRCGGSAGWTVLRGRWSSCFPFNPAAVDIRPEHQHRQSYRMVRPGGGWPAPARRARRLQSKATQQRRRLAMSRLDDLAERIERLVLRHEELKRTNALLEQQLASVSSERDSLRSRLSAARARIDALLDRLPAEPVVAAITPALRQASPPDRNVA